MISLDQVLLLEEKVESAVAKIAQLNAENAALRRKCAELTNALSAKTEQFSNFQTDQGKIEEGILKALERLNTVENAIHAAAAATTNQTIQAAPKTAASPAPQSQQASETNTPSMKIPDADFESVSVESFDTASPVSTQEPSANENTANQDNSSDAQSIQSTFDIF